MIPGEAAGVVELAGPAAAAVVAGAAGGLRSELEVEATGPA